MSALPFDFAQGRRASARPVKRGLLRIALSARRRVSTLSGSATAGNLEPFGKLRVPSEVEGQGVFYAAPKLWLQIVAAKAHIS